MPSLMSFCGDGIKLFLEHCYFFTTFKQLSIIYSLKKGQKQKEEAHSSDVTCDF